MIPLLAETAPDLLKPWLESFFWLSAGVGVVLGCLVAVKNLRRPDQQQVSITQQPVSVKAHPEYATVGDIDQLHGRIKRERIEIDRIVADLKAEDVRLREKLDADIADLHERINDVPERTIKLLRETKDLI